MIGQRFQREPASHVLCQQAQGLHLLEAAHDVHLRLGVAGGGVELGLELRSQLGPVGHAHQMLRGDQLVEQLRLPRDHLRSPGAGCQQPGQLPQRGRVFGEQRQIGGAAGDGLDQGSQAIERGFGLAECADDFQRRR